VSYKKKMEIAVFCNVGSIVNI